MTDDHATTDEPGYADAVLELEEILEQLDDDDLDVDLLAERVDRAATLIRLCRSRINDAQLQVERIVADFDEVAGND